MAGRPRKVGLDYFELDCLLDNKMKLIQAEFGLKGFAIVVKLYQKIYGGQGYYCEWNTDELLLFMNDGFVDRDSKNLIDEIILACIRRDIFSEKLFKKYQILTSAGIQKRYLRAVSKRELVDLKKEYLVISVGENTNNIDINSINDGRNSINAVGITQSKSKSNKDTCSPKPNLNEQRERDFAIIYGIYPRKRGKTKAFDNYLVWLKGKSVNGKRVKLTNKQMYLAVQNYVRQQEERGAELEYYKNFDTLMGKQLLDYVREDEVDE